MMRSQAEGPVVRCFILEGLVDEEHRNQVEHAAAMAGLTTEFLLVSECRDMGDVLHELAEPADE